MPSWSIHLNIAKKLNKKLKIDMDLFYFGSLVPDVDKDWNIDRHFTHYYGTKVMKNFPKSFESDLDKFVEHYNTRLDNPILLGYFFHLLTDDFYNKYIFRNKLVMDKDGNFIGYKKYDKSIVYFESYKEFTKIKHDELEDYGRLIFDINDVRNINNIDKILLYSQALAFDLNEENIKSRVEYLNNEFVDFNNYENISFELFSKEELDKLLDDCVKYLVAVIDNFLI